MRRTLAIVLLLTGPAWAAQPLARISGPSRVPADPLTGQASFLLMGTESISDAPLRWVYLNNKTRKFPTFTGDDGRKGVMLAATQAGVGVHKFALAAMGRPEGAKPEADMDLDIAYVEVEVYDPSPPKPVPVDPTPPAPPAPPIPVTPPAPEVVGNLRVVVLYESSQALGPAQNGALYARDGIYPYLNAHCLKDVNGNPSWRAWDKDVDVSNEPAEWQDAMAKAKADPMPLPKVVVFGGNAFIASATILNKAASLAFLQQYGGK